MDHSNSHLFLESSTELDEPPQKRVHLELSPSCSSSVSFTIQSDFVNEDMKKSSDDIHWERLIGLPQTLPPAISIAERDSTVPHAPIRTPNLSEEEKELALSNALRYFPRAWHGELAIEFAEELQRYGHVYMYRFRPRDFEIRAYPIDLIPARCQHAAAVMLMILNNLDIQVAQYPHELITYGGNGSVFQNWAQFRLVMKYLSEMENDQTLVMYSGHPLGLFPSSKDAPRVIVSNGMTIPNYSSLEDYERMYALGCTQYGQMTAGSYAYIGPQGIVHGTTLTVLNAARLYLKRNDLSGVVFATSGLGGMSGAQAKAAVIAGAVGVIAEVDPDALYKRYRQGWLQEVITDLDALIVRVREAKKRGEATSIGFLGNVVDMWEKFASESEHLVDLASDQTSCHNPFGGGYYPVGLSLEESRQLMVEDPQTFRVHVEASLRRHIAAINLLHERGMPFFDYGNAFLLQCSRAGADVMNQSGSAFRYPSYVQSIMGDIFSLGFGPFRWVCTSCKAEDLALSDRIAADVIESLAREAPDSSKKQYEDNLKWILAAGQNQLVVGSQARILYTDAVGRVEIALAFNQAIAEGRISSPIVLSRDHHDVSGADSHVRETSNIYDGSKYSADMVVQTVIGDACRGATWVALHNGGGTGFGEALNCGFGLLLDGSEDAAQRARSMLWWDVNNGLARRSWSGHPLAIETIHRNMKRDPKLSVTVPENVDDRTLIQQALRLAEESQKNLDLEK